MINKAFEAPEKVYLSDKIGKNKFWSGFFSNVLKSTINSTINERPLGERNVKPKSEMKKCHTGLHRKTSRS